jgi:hypothetical protein
VLLRVRHVENPVYYRKIHYPNLWDPIFPYEPENSPLSVLIKGLTKTKVDAENMKWLEDG